MSMMETPRHVCDPPFSLLDGLLTSLPLLNWPEINITAQPVFFVCAAKHGLAWGAFIIAAPMAAQSPAPLPLFASKLDPLRAAMV